MQPPGSSAEDSQSPTRRQLQGPRPPQLRVRKESHMIKKPPIAPPPPQRQAPPQRTEATTVQNRQTVIIYAVSPKVIHTTATDFMSLVQRLTGSSSTSAATTTTSVAVSPAARLASIERASPKEREKDREIASDVMDMFEGVEVGQIPGILSPAPAALQPISPGFFSPGSDLHALSLFNDLSPFIHGNMFLPSPSNLFSAPMVSPSPYSFDPFNPFLDF
ncbi:hypothetical protein U1Q18_011149 [Sarracenia purpurea var. burkii]